jgi:L-histidine N-alpha-methyltransferase
VAKACFSVALREGETVWTETSHKYSLAEVETLARKTGFQPDAQWVDQEWPFAETLLTAA